LSDEQLTLNKQMFENTKVCIEILKIF